MTKIIRMAMVVTVAGALSAASARAQTYQPSYGPVMPTAYENTDYYADEGAKSPSDKPPMPPAPKTDMPPMATPPGPPAAGRRGSGRRSVVWLRSRLRAVVIPAAKDVAASSLARIRPRPACSAIAAGSSAMM